MRAREAFLDLVAVDWSRAAREKDRYWCETKRALGPSHGLEVADELRRFAQAQDGAWPSELDRRADHACHRRLAADLDRIPSRRHPALR